MKCYYPNLELEIFKNGLKRKKIADSIGISERTLRNKLNGLSDFTWSEVCRIQKVFFPDLKRDELFKTKNNT